MKYWVIKITYGTVHRRRVYWLINSKQHPGKISWSPAPTNALHFDTEEDAKICLRTGTFIGDQDDHRARVLPVGSDGTYGEENEQTADQTKRLG